VTRVVAILALAVTGSSQSLPKPHERKVVCACVAPSCHFGRPVAAGWIYEPEKIDGESPDAAWLPEGTPSGMVILNVRIDEHGRVTDACVLRGISPRADTKVIAAVMTWRYEPAALARPQEGNAAGTPVPIAITVAVEIK
jgi:TonB family protein